MRRAVYVATTMPGPDLVARLYDHALAGDPTALLAEAASAAGLDALGFAFHDDVIADRPLVAHGIEAAARTAYPRHHREDRVWSAAMCAVPLGTVQEALPRPLLERTRMHEEWLRPQRWSHVVTARVWAEPGWRGGLVGGRVRPPTARRRTPIAVLEQLVPHVRRAIEAWRQLDQVQGLAAVSADVLDVLPIAIVLVDPRAMVTSMNRAAEALMDVGRDPQWDGGRLRFASVEATRRLRTACADGATASFVVARSGRAPLEVLVSPLPGDARGVMAVVLGDRERIPAIEPDALRAAYGLTPAQANLAAFLAQGFSLEDAAAHFGVTIGTARDRVKQVFARTGTRSQADLVRLVLTGPGLVERPSEGAERAAPFGPLFLADVLGGRLVRRGPPFEG